MKRRSGGGTEEFIKNNIKTRRREREREREDTDKDRSRARSRELYKEKKKNPLHDSSYTFPQTVAVVKAG